ncbi:MAG: hypothetical protein WAN86_17835 [Hyphomicrobiaceae bacterium]
MHNKFRKLTDELVLGEEGIILDAIETFNKKLEENEKTLALVRITTEGVVKWEADVFAEFIEYRRFLAHKNRHLESLPARFVMSLERNPQPGVGRK